MQHRGAIVSSFFIPKAQEPDKLKQRNPISLKEADIAEDE